MYETGSVNTGMLLGVEDIFIELYQWPRDKDFGYPLRSSFYDPKLSHDREDDSLHFSLTSVVDLCIKPTSYKIFTYINGDTTLRFSSWEELNTKGLSCTNGQWM